MHDRKIQGMKLATAPLLCDLSPWTSVTPCCVFALLPIANKVAEKMQITFINRGQHCTVEWKVTSNAIRSHNLLLYRIEISVMCNAFQMSSRIFN